MTAKRKNRKDLKDTEEEENVKVEIRRLSVRSPGSLLCPKSHTAEDRGGNDGLDAPKERTSEVTLEVLVEEKSGLTSGQERLGK